MASLNLDRHPGAGRDPVATRKVEPQRHKSRARTSRRPSSAVATGSRPAPGWRSWPCRLCSASQTT